MKNIYLLSVCTITRQFDDYRNEYPFGFEQHESVKIKVFCGDSWIETLENTVKELSNILTGKGLSADSSEDELTKAIIEHDLSENILTKAFETKEEAEAELVRIKKEAAAACEGYTLVHSHCDFEKYVHNDFLDVVFGNYRFRPDWFWKIIECYENGSDCPFLSLSDKNWEVWFSKIKTINDDTFDEVLAMFSPIEYESMG